VTFTFVQGSAEAKRLKNTAVGLQGFLSDRT